MKKLTNKHLGFTLIELLVVATIIILLATIGVVSYRNASINSRNSKRKADLEVVRQAMIMYRSEEGSYPAVNNFTRLLGALYPDYLTEQNISDPKGTGYSGYEYNGTNTLKAYLEPDGTAYEIRLP